MTDLLSIWLEDYAASPGSCTAADGVHTMALGDDVLVNVKHEPGPAAQVVVFSAPGHLPGGRADDMSRDAALTPDGGWRIDVDPCDGLLLLSLSTPAAALDEAAFHELLSRFLITHLLWVVLLQPTERDEPAFDTAGRGHPMGLAASLA